MTTSDARAAFDTLLNLPTLVKNGRVTANWLPGGGFWYVDGAPESISLQVFDPKTGESSPMFDTATVRETYRKTFGREAPGKGLPFDAAHRTPKGYAVVIEGARYTLGDGGATLTLIPGADLAEQMWAFGAGVAPDIYPRTNIFNDPYPTPAKASPDGRWTASIRDDNVWLRASDANARREQLTTGGEYLDNWDLGVGAVSPWSPDSGKLFVSRYDRRGMNALTRIRWNMLSDEIENTYMPRAGERFPAVTPYVLDIHSRQATPIDVPVEDRMLVPVGWAPESSAVFFVQFSRDMAWAGVWRADAVTGAATLLFEDKTDTFLRAQHDIINGRTGCTLLPEGGFLWVSQRDGWMHLHHYAADGSYKGQLTKGGWPVRDVQAVDAEGGLIYFTAHHDEARPYDVHLCRVPLAGGAVERLTEGEGVHEAQISPDRSLFIDTVSRPDFAPQSTLRRTSGEVLKAFTPSDTAKLDATGWQTPEQICVKAADGESDLWAVLYKPRDFDPAKSYPVVECIYGGPQHPQAMHNFPLLPSTLINMCFALPQLGYVMLMIDGRGTSDRSKAFLDATYKDWRRHVTADHACALRAIAKDRPWMDLDRVGLWGHSWGGYFTFANLIDNPDLYRAGICSAPSLSPYDSFLYEPYLGGPPAGHNRAAYEDAHLPSDAGKLTSDLLLVAGSNDMMVWHSTVHMTEALIQAGRQHEMVMLPGQFHVYGSTHSAYFIEKLVDFFDRKLKHAEPRHAAS